MSLFGAGSVFDTLNYDPFGGSGSPILPPLAPVNQSQPAVYTTSDPGFLDRAIDSVGGFFRTGTDFLFNIVETAAPALGEIAARRLVNEAGSRLDIPTTTVPVRNDVPRVIVPPAAPSNADRMTDSPTGQAPFFDGFGAGLQSGAEGLLGGGIGKVAVIGGAALVAFLILRR